MDEETVTIPTDISYLSGHTINTSDVTNGSTFLQSDLDHEYMYTYYYYYEYKDHAYKIFDFEKPMYGYLWPILVIFTTCCNFVVIGGFLRKHMRTPTNVILVFLAISDSMTGIVTLPVTFYVFTNEHELLSKDWCNATMITRLYISRAFHTVSVWETLLLGVHRFLQVRYPNLAQKFCTMKKTVGLIALTYVLAFVLHSYHAFDVKALHGFCVWHLPDDCGWACVYIWMTLLFCHLLPCITLVVLAVNMMRTLYMLNNSMDQQTSINRRKERNRKATLVVVLIVLIFLIPELPYGIFYLMIVFLRHSKQNIFPLRTNRIVHTAYELLLVLSFHLNFWVYCLMIPSFRNLLKQLIRFVTFRPVSFKPLETEVSSSSDRGGVELAGIRMEHNC